MILRLTNYFFFTTFFAVLAACLKSDADGAALEPTRFIFSSDPAAMRFFFALMLAYNPGFFIAFVFCKDNEQLHFLFSCLLSGLSNRQGNRYGLFLRFARLHFRLYILADGLIAESFFEWHN
jgi:hypothetical protein